MIVTFARHSPVLSHKATNTGLFSHIFHAYTQSLIGISLYEKSILILFIVSFTDTDKSQSANKSNM